MAAGAAGVGGGVEKARLACTGRSGKKGNCRGAGTWRLLLRMRLRPRRLRDAIVSCHRRTRNEVDLVWSPEHLSIFGDHLLCQPQTLHCTMRILSVLLLLLVALIQSSVLAGTDFYKILG